MSRDGVQSVMQGSGLDSLLAAIYEKSRGDVFGLTRQQFETILGEIARKYLPVDAAQNDLRDLYSTLRVEEWPWPGPVLQDRSTRGKFF